MILRPLLPPEEPKTKGHAVAYTESEGGVFLPGIPPDDYWHSTLYSDWWIFDRTLARFRDEGRYGVTSAWRKLRSDIPWSSELDWLKAKMEQP